VTNSVMKNSSMQEEGVMLAQKAATEAKRNLPQTNGGPVSEHETNFYNGVCNGWGCDKGCLKVIQLPKEYKGLVKLNTCIVIIKKLECVSIEFCVFHNGSKPISDEG